MLWRLLFRWRSLTSQSRLYLQNLVHRHLAALAIRTIERTIFWSQSFKWLVFLLPLCYRNLRLRNGLKYATGANAIAGFVHACLLFFVLMSIWCFDLCSVCWVYVGTCFGLTCIFSPFTNILDLFLGNRQNGEESWLVRLELVWRQVGESPCQQGTVSFEPIFFFYRYQSKIGIHKVGTASNVYDCTFLWWFDHVSPGHGAGSKWASWVPQQADKFAKKMGKAAVDSKGRWVNENAAWNWNVW